MNLPKQGMTTKCQDNSNTEELFKDQAALSESGIFKATGTRPKPFPTHNGTAVLPNLMTNRSYHHRYPANQAYFLPPWNHDTGPETNKSRILNVSSTSLSNREHNPSLTKTKICDHWRRSGTCSYGDSCWYAHGEDDLRKLNGTRNGRSEEKTNKENEKVGARRPPVSIAEDFQEDAMTKIMKPAEEPKEVPPTKRTSTNVKGLTVTIPPNIAFKEQVSNASLPLSPAQERWISMSIGGNGVPAVNEKGNDLSTVLSSSTMMNDSDNEFEKKQSLENAFDRRQTSGQYVRSEDISVKQDEFSFLSPNPVSFSGRLPSHNSHASSHHRSFSRGPPQRTAHTATPFGGISQQQQQQHPSSGLHQARVSRSGASGFGSGFEESRSFLHSQRSSSLIRSARDFPHIPHNGSHPQIQQACWNLAGEMFQRQKDIETSGMRSVLEQHQQSQMSSRKFEEFELSRLLAQQQQQQKKKEMMLEYEAATKLQELAYIRYQLERGAIRSNQVPRELWNELKNLPLLNHVHHQNGNNGIKSHGAASSDCSCGNSRPKHPAEHVSLHSNFTQARQQMAHHPLHHHSMQQQQHHHFRRYGMPTTTPSDLTAPPKIFESLLPSDDSFSIWLDPKPKKESSGFLRPPARNIDHSDSGTSLLAKMEMLRSEHVPITEEDIALANGPIKSSHPEKPANSGRTSPVALSLMELLSNEKLLDNTSRNVKPKTTMFDFDSFKIAETLGMTPQPSACRKNESPIFFVGEEKSVGYEDAGLGSSGLFTPLSANNPFMERCDFFAASGSCPFGDSCHLSHSIPDQAKKELKAL